MSLSRYVQMQSLDAFQDIRVRFGCLDQLPGIIEVHLMDSNRAPTVFLSYASADREAARVLRDALPTLGLEVWYDESELGGGEIWDQKIRKQIRECDYFMPLISAQTEAA